jgi:hypothetical protein
MKKLLLIFCTLFIIISLCSCNNPANSEAEPPHPLFNHNNATNEELFGTYHYERKGSGNGIIGEWAHIDSYNNVTTYIFNSDSTLIHKVSITTQDVFGDPVIIDNSVSNGTFTIESIENDNDNMIFIMIPWSAADNEFQIFVSQNYLTLKKYEGSPIEYSVLDTGINVKWFRDSVYAVRINYGKTVNSDPQEFKAVPIDNDSQRDVFIELPISELKWAEILVYSKKYWKHGFASTGYYNNAQIIF